MLAKEYTNSYITLRSSLREVQLEVDVLGIRKDELTNPTTKLGYLKLDQDTYLRDLTTNSQIDLALSGINNKIHDLNKSVAIPNKIFTGIQKLKKNDLFVDIIADDYYDDYNRYGYGDKIRLIQGYLIKEAYRPSPYVPPVFDPPLSDGSGQAYREALAAGESTVAPLELEEDEIIKQFAINSLGTATKSYLNDKPDLKNEILTYLGSTSYDKPEMDCTHFLFNTYLGGQQFDTDTRFYFPLEPNFGQTAFTPNVAVSFSLNPHAISNGFEGFGNVLHEFFKDPKMDKAYEGKITRDIFSKNNILTSPNITNEQLGILFDFSRTKLRDEMHIVFTNDIGSVLYHF